MDTANEPVELNGVPEYEYAGGADGKVQRANAPCVSKISFWIYAVCHPRPAPNAKSSKNKVLINGVADALICTGVNVPFEFGQNVIGLPEGIEVTLVGVAGLGFTRTVIVLEFVQPNEVTPFTVYDVVATGETLMLLPTTGPGVQVYTYVKLVLLT